MPLKAPRGFISETDPAVCQIGHPAPPWLVNYADLMTELVCFFVILYALSAALNKNVQNAAAEVKEMMEKGEMSGEVKVDREGLKISIEEQGHTAYFESGYSDITPEMKGVLDKMAPILRKLTDKHDVIIEGHTDNVPISNDYFGSNWELSTARALTVVRFLQEQGKIEGRRLVAAGRGEWAPVAPNDTPANKARNRRIEIALMPNLDELPDLSSLSQ